jgi:hypothetical protein
MEELGFHWMDLHEIGCFEYFWKSIDRTQVSLKFDRNNWYLS